MLLGYVSLRSDLSLDDQRELLSQCDYIIEGDDMLQETLKMLGPDDMIAATELLCVARDSRALTVFLHDLTKSGASLFILDPAEQWARTMNGATLADAVAGLVAFDTNLRARAQRIAMQEARERGVTCGRPPKLSPSQHEEARRRYASGESQAQIARHFRVSPSTINYLLRGPRARSNPSVKP